jgi:primosomal protein N' (replication factor Y)
LTYHLTEDLLRCHYCGLAKSPPSQCPNCAQSSLTRLGFGTQRVEEEVRRIAPQARLVRIDRDTVGRSLELVKQLNAIRDQRADVLIGTQMVAKGHDFPNITLVGIVNADAGLQIPDYRAGELTVQLMMQVAGRAGRGFEPGRVILQTYNPQHYTVEAVLQSDYAAFCAQELESRSQLRYPPFVRLARLLLVSPLEERTREAAQNLGVVCRQIADRLREAGRHVAVLGPSPAPLAKLKRNFRWQILLKSWQNQDLEDFLERVLAARSGVLKGTPHLIVDRDPVATL